MKIALKVLLFFFIHLICIISGNAQKLNYGLGISHQTNFFGHNDREQFKGSFYRPALSHNWGIQTFLDINTSSGFGIRLLANSHLRTMTLAFKPPGIRASKRNGTLKTFYGTLETKMYARYLLKSKNWSFYPKFGLGLGFHSLGGNSLRGGTGLRSIEQLPPELEDENPVYVNGGLVTGGSIQPPFLVKKRRIELDIDIFISPRDFLDYPILIESGTQNLEIQGKYHYISFAINYFFRKENPND